MTRTHFIPGIVLAAVLSGCADFKCAPEYCASDAQITDEVRAVFAQHTEFGAPGQFRVQTINGVVYLYGQSNSELERRSAGELAKGVPNVKKVVNSIYPRSNGR